MSKIALLYQCITRTCLSVLPTMEMVKSGSLSGGAVSLFLSPFIAPRLRALSPLEQPLPVRLDHVSPHRNEGIVTFCQACRERSLRKQEVPCKQEKPSDGCKPLAYLYACDACGERYLVLTYFNTDGGRIETWWYYIDQSPLLRRVARYQPVGPIDEQELVSAEYLIGEEPVSERVWKTALAQKRRAERDLCPAAKVRKEADV